MSKPMISVVMPVYNAEKYLDEAIQSILNQTYKDFEFIIINDGSRDKSLEIINKYKNIDDRIILVNRENKGLIFSLNEGVSIAKGKYIARMDSDDISLPTRFEKQIELMEKDGLDICGSHYFTIKEDGILNGLNLTPRTHDLCVLSLSSKVPFAHPSVMIKKDFLYNRNLQYGQSIYRAAEDFDLWIRMCENGAKFGNVDDVLFKYRILSNSLSKINNKSIKNDTKNMIRDFIKNNKKQIINIMESKFDILNDEEISIIVRSIYKIYLSKLNLKKMSFLKTVNRKNLVCTLLSEIVN